MTPKITEHSIRALSGEADGFRLSALAIEIVAGDAGMAKEAAIRVIKNAPKKAKENVPKDIGNDVETTAYCQPLILLLTSRQVRPPRSRGDFPTRGDATDGWGKAVIFGRQIIWPSIVFSVSAAAVVAGLSAICVFSQNFALGEALNFRLPIGKGGQEISEVGCSIKLPISS